MRHSHWTISFSTKDSSSKTIKKIIMKIKSFTVRKYKNQRIKMKNSFRNVQTTQIKTINKLQINTSETEKKIIRDISQHNKTYEVNKKSSLVAFHCNK